MHRAPCCRSAALGAVLAIGPIVGPVAAQDSTPRATLPNVVVIFADDMGWGDVSWHGATGYATPNLDRMAAEGVRLTDFYVAQPVCSASRAALLTGCYPTRIGIAGALGPNARHGLHADEWTLAEVCKQRGYETAIYGKWHLGHLPEFLPRQHGFDDYYGIPYSNDMGPHHPTSPKAWGDLPTIDGEQAVGFNTDQDRFTGDFTDRAVAFIERAVAADHPFFCYLPHPMPHVPLHASAAFRGSTDCGLYGDVIAEIDWSVGQILDVLARTGVDQDTLVLFTSDNGPWLSYGDHGGSAGALREGKGTTFEGGVRVPAVVRWPGRIPAGRVQRQPTMTIDVLPTIAALLEVELPADRPIDGKDVWSLWSCADGATNPHDAYYFWYHDTELEAMRSGRWKLHFPHRYRTLQGRSGGTDGKPADYGEERIGPALFDLDVDPGETTDVSAEHTDVVARLGTMADAMRVRLGDRLTGVSGAEVRAPGRVQ